MTFLPIASDDSLSPAQTAARDHQLETYGGHFTNLKATLLSHVPSFDAYMQWYVLRDELAPFIGERAVSLFSYAISDENDCLVSSAYFRRILIDNGEDPDSPQVTEVEQLLIDWGRLHREVARGDSRRPVRPSRGRVQPAVAGAARRVRRADGRDQPVHDRRQGAARRAAVRVPEAGMSAPPLIRARPPCALRRRAVRDRRCPMTQ